MRDSKLPTAGETALKAALAEIGPQPLQDGKTDAAVWFENGRGLLRASDGRTVKDVADEWLEDARKGVIRNRSGDVYKPSAIRVYGKALRLYVVPALGSRKFTQLQRADVQALVDELHGEQRLSASSILGALMPLKAIYRRAVARGLVAVNPTSGLEMPAMRGRRDRIVSPEHATTLLGALSEDDRALWATALYAGLRCGELQALRWEDVELLEGVIHVRRGWDEVEGEIAPKSRTSVRKVPVPTILRGHLEALYARSDDLRVFGKDGRPFDPRRVGERAKAAWKDRELVGLTLHECRHTYASFMIASGCNAKALSVYMGHANISTTFDKYGHLMPGNESEAAALLDAFLTPVE